MTAREPSRPRQQGGEGKSLDIVKPPRPRSKRVIPDSMADSTDFDTQSYVHMSDEEYPAPYPSKPKKGNDILGDWVEVVPSAGTKRSRRKNEDQGGRGGPFAGYRSKNQKTESSGTSGSRRNQGNKNGPPVKLAGTPLGKSTHETTFNGTPSSLKAIQAGVATMTVKPGTRKTVVASNRRTPRRTTSRRESGKPQISPKSNVRRAFERRLGANTEIIFRIFHLDGPPDEERAIGITDGFIIRDLNSTATVLDLKKQIREATKTDDSRLEIDQMYLEITSLPGRRLNLEGIDNRTFAQLGINGLTYPNVQVNMRNRPAETDAVNAKRFPLGLMVNVDVRDARSDRWILEFKGLDETIRLRNLKQRVTTLTRVPVASQAWYYEFKSLGVEESGKQLQELMSGGRIPRDTFIVMVKDEKVFVDYQMPDVGIPDVDVEMPDVEAGASRGKNNDWLTRLKNLVTKI